MNFVQKLLKGIFKEGLTIGRGLSLLIFLNAVAFIGMSIYNYMVSDYKYLASEKFNKDLWNKGYGRAPYYFDLKKNYLHKGLPMDKVKELLGRPTVWRVYYKKGKEVKRCYDYSLGVLGGFVVTDYSMVICPNKNNQLHSVYLVSDSTYVFHRDSGISEPYNNN